MVWLSEGKGYKSADVPHAKHTTKGPIFSTQEALSLPLQQLRRPEKTKCSEWLALLIQSRDTAAVTCRNCSWFTNSTCTCAPTLHVPVQQFLNINKVGSKMHFFISYLGEDKKKHAKVCPAMADHSNSISRGH